MRITKNKLNQTLDRVIENNKSEFFRHRIDGLSFQSVSLKKNRNRDDYDIIVSVDEINVPLILIRDIVEETCQELNIHINKILIEI